MRALHRALCGAVLAAACSVPDPDHCSNRGGASVCVESGLGTHCSLCVSANNGCVDQPPSASCAPGDSAAQTTAAPPTSSSDSSSTAPATSSSASTTSTSTSSSTSGPSTSSSTGASSDSGDTTATTAPPAMCGNDLREPGELCDGADLGDADCNSVNQKWGGGTLLCADSCAAYDQTMCCLNVGETCIPGSMEPNQMCCAPSQCVVSCM
ncbi:MAG: hypothetical protein JNL82_29400 [Myxococcales bacterium]|nr:hypothetical protein [Myxococcales bacterium]